MQTLSNILKKGKSQVTLMVIVGFVVLIVFMLFLFSVNTLNSLKVRSEAKKALTNFIETSTIQQYTLSCIDTVLNDGLEKITLQGGNIYDYQCPAGLCGVNTSDFIQGKDFLEINISNLNIDNNLYEDNTTLINVSYGMLISKNDDAGEIYISNSNSLPPTYPIPFKVLNEISGFGDYVAGYFVPMLEGLYGEIHLPFLCENYEDCKYDSQIFASFTNKSMQKQLEEYLEVNVKDCVNFSYFEKLTPYNITEGEVDANINFGVDKVSVVLDFPLQIDVQGKEPVTEILTFNKDKNYRLTKVYRLIHTMLKYDSFDLFFDPLSYKNVYNGGSIDFNCKMLDRSRCYDNQISVYKFSYYTDVAGTRHDDLIVVVDNASKILGKPLIFPYFIENRRPALDYIHEYPNPELDIVVFENQTINLNPQAYDPDNDTIQKYEYSGWREDFYTDFDKDQWYDELGWLDDPPDYAHYTTIHNDNPHNWTNSQQYIDTEQNASYHVKYGELGYHDVNITIWDSEGLRDWQTIKILVRDLPKAIANASNNYSDIPNLKASVEDPYILDGSLSYAIIGEITQNNWFIWREDLEDIDIHVQLPVITLPYDVNYDILNLTPYNFNKTFLEDNLPGSEYRTLKLTIGTLVDGSIMEGEPDYLDIEVHQCLPHVNDIDTITPYPYSDKGFQATHVCCADGSGVKSWGTLKDENDPPCFTKIEYSSLKYFQDNTTDWYTNNFLPESGTPVSYTYVALNDKVNNIFKRTFTRKCDGSRGNICNGSANADVVTETSCDYIDTTVAGNAWQDYQCYGPHNDYFSQASEGIIDCVIYDETTNFEKLYDGSASSDSCSNQKACYGADLEFNPIYKNDSIGRNADSVEILNPVALSPIVCEKAYCAGSVVTDYTNHDINSGDCTYVYGDDCYCSNECGSAGNCHEKDPGYTFESHVGSGRFDLGCNLDCQVPVCLPYAFNPVNFDCYSICSRDEQCAYGTVCDQGFIVFHEECLKCNLVGDGIQISGTHGAWDCEKACGADDECDEVAKNSPIPTIPGFKCNFDCEKVPL